ncbi:MAG: histidinol-phosphate transaminase [Boseongicola sp.]|nr:MAG: histidinol-phosphate transaminase [Boseongicola sp.]
MKHVIDPKPGIEDIVLYKGGESRLAGHDEVLKLSSNENPFGCSEAAKAALVAAVASMHRYPSSDHVSLRRAIAEVHGLDVERIICGAGSDEILTFLCQTFVGPEHEVIHTEHGFSLYPVLIKATGGTPVQVPEKNRVVDVDAILAAVTPATRMVFLTNPGNPTGTLLPVEELARLADGLPGDVLLVLDGAYVEFAEGYDGAVALVDAHQNVVMTRTFSKLYGLGGLRIGWGYGSARVIDLLNRVKGPFNLGGPQLAAAEAAMRDRGFAEMYQGENARLRVWLAEALTEVGVPSDPSHANYILARFADQAEAEACDAALREDGILVRKVAGYNLPNCLRITVGTEADCARVAASVRRFKGMAQ